MGVGGGGGVQTRLLATCKDLKLLYLSETADDVLAEDANSVRQVRAVALPPLDSSHFHFFFFFCTSLRCCFVCACSIPA